MAQRRLAVIVLGALAGCGLEASGLGDAGGDPGAEDRADRADDAQLEVPDEGPPDVAVDDGESVGPDGPDDAADATDVPADEPLDEAPADVWPDGWLPGWERRVALTIDPDDIDEALTDFPVLVHLGASAGRGPDDVGFVFDELATATDRRKLAVTTADGLTECFVELERWDATGREAWLWVRVPSVAADAATVLYLYFDVTHAINEVHVGDPGMSAAREVWSNGYRLVFHMQNDPDNEHTRDSTGNGNRGTRGAPGEPYQVLEGRIGAALRWDGVGENEFIRVEDSASLDLGSSFTAELWVVYEKGRIPDDYERMLSKKAEWTDLDGWEFSLERNLDRFITTRGSSGAGTSGIANVVESWAAGGWHHVAVFYDGIWARALVDGSQDDDVVITTVVDNDRPLFVGRYGGSLIHRWFGMIDEIRVSDTVRSDAWIRAGYESGRDDLVDFGPEETRF